MKAVKFYSTMPSDNEDVIKGVDGEIPALVEFTNIAPDETYTLMTDEEYLEYMNSIQPELDAWKIIQEN